MRPHWRRFPVMPRNAGIGLVEPTDSFIYLSTDVGIGGAVVRDGHVVRGDHGFGGELGHVSVDMRDRSAVAVAADAWGVQAVGRWSVRPASPAAMPRPRESINELIDTVGASATQRRGRRGRRPGGHGLGGHVDHQRMRYRYRDARWSMGAFRTRPDPSDRTHGATVRAGAVVPEVQAR